MKAFDLAPDLLLYDGELLQVPTQQQAALAELAAALRGPLPAWRALGCPLLWPLVPLKAHRLQVRTRTYPEVPAPVGNQLALFTTDHQPPPMSHRPLRNHQ